MKPAALLLLFLALGCGPASEVPDASQPDADAQPEAHPAELWVTIRNVVQPPLEVGRGGCYQFVDQPATSATPCDNIAAHLTLTDDTCAVTCTPTGAKTAMVHLACGACSGDYALALGPMP